MAIKCCKDCVPPKRHPGCHSKCEQYIKEKQDWEEEKVRIKANQPVPLYASDFEMLACMHKHRKDYRR